MNPKQFSEDIEKKITNRAVTEETVLAGLQSGKNILITSLPGMGKLSLVRSVAVKAGLKPLELDLSTGINFGSAPTEKAQVQDDLQNKEKFILDSVERANANAIIVDLFSKEDMTAFINVASKLNIPLIVSTTHNDRSNDKLSVSTYDNLLELQSAVAAIEVPKEMDLNIGVLEKMRICSAIKNRIPPVIESLDPVIAERNRILTSGTIQEVREMYEKEAREGGRPKPKQ